MTYHDIAAAWTAYLASRRNPAGPIRTGDVAEMMALAKRPTTPFPDAEWRAAVEREKRDA